MRTWFLFWHPRCLHSIASLFAAVGNVAWLNRYYNADVMWQEDAICARSKTNTASVSQHDPINAVCKKDSLAHTPTRTQMRIHTLAKRRIVVAVHDSLGKWMNSIHRETEVHANSKQLGTEHRCLRVRHHRVSNWLFSPSSHIWVWAREREQKSGGHRKLKKNNKRGSQLFFFFIKLATRCAISEIL